MAKRKTVLGLPIGKKRSHLGLAPTLTSLGAAALPIVAMPAARRIAQAVSSGAKSARQVSDVAETATQIKNAVSERSSTLGKVGAVVSEVKKIGGNSKNSKPKLSHLIEEHTEIAVPRSVAYNQWTQFEMFPSITKGAEQVEQKDRTKVSWTMKIGPSRRTLDAQITEQVPDERIAFESKGGLDLRGVVTFHSLDRDLTRVLVEMQYEPKGFVETIGNLLRVQRRRVRRDLRLYKHFLELRNEETGAWRGRIAKQKNGNNDSAAPNSHKANSERKVS
jgi:uncharacterized membrane protein